MKSVGIYHGILNVMFESTLQSVGSHCITIQTMIPLINFLNF